MSKLNTFGNNDICFYTIYYSKFNSFISLFVESGMDFVPISAVTLGPIGHYVTRRCIPVSIIDDGDCERRAERFYLTLQTNEDLVTFSRNNIPIIIDGTTEQVDCGMYVCYKINFLL